MKIILKRTLNTPKFVGGVFLSEDGKQICVSGERGKNVDHPCIPPGDYVCFLQEHCQENGKCYPSYEIKDVPNRTNIEIHILNDPVTESLGCIGTGMTVVKGGAGGWHISFSSVAYKKFISFLNGHDWFTLSIIEDFGPEPTEDPELPVGTGVSGTTPVHEKPPPFEEPTPVPSEEVIGSWVGRLYRSIRSWIARVNAEFDRTKWEKFLSFMRDIISILAGVLKPKI